MYIAHESFLKRTDFEPMYYKFFKYLVHVCVLIMINHILCNRSSWYQYVFKHLLWQYI